MQTSHVTANADILVVDDLDTNIFLLRTFLEPLGYAVRSATNGEECLRQVDLCKPDLILLDLVMPGMDGFEVCQQLKGSAETRHIPIIIITGVNERQANVQAVEAGADDFLVKPFDRVLLEARIRSSLRAKVMQDQILEHQHELEERVRERTVQLEVTQQVTVFCLAKLAESRDNETGDHLDRMRLYARELADEICSWARFESLDDDFPQKIYQSSPLHDIGKVGIPDEILLKPGKLDPEEFDIMKSHTLIGGETLRAADHEAGKNSFLAMGRDIAYYHHERWDGAGYPFGLKSDDIPLAARIVALADVYDALSSRRPYKEPFDHERSRAIILEGRGTHFDPLVVDAFLAREQNFIRIRDEFQYRDQVPPLQALVEGLNTQRKSHGRNRLPAKLRER